MNLDPSIAETANRLLTSIRSKPQSEVQSAADKAKREALAAAGERFGAPRRHWERVPNKNGPWGQKLAILEGMLGTGMIAGIHGGRGPGKTQLGVECMKWCYAHRKLAAFTSATEVFSRLKASYRPDSTKSELEVISDYRKPFLLVIDEIGKRGQTDWEDSLLFLLLNKRYEDMTDTILICNLNKEQFTESIGSSVVSRIIECGGLIECTWPSFRGAK